MNTGYNHLRLCGDYMWIYEYENWPKFTWDHEKINKALLKIRYK
jgi:hypothetical protein